MDVSFMLPNRPILVNNGMRLDMKNGFFAVGMTAWLLSGCSHFSNSTYESPTSPHKIACDDTPPNQPGCYNRQYQEGIINKLIDSFRERT